MRSAVTISLVSEARGGPFVFWDDLAASCETAKQLGFDAVEVFAPSAESVASADLGRLLADHNLSLAAMGTGAGWLKHKLTLTSPDGSVRRRAIDFVKSIIDAAGQHHAPAIIGSMQGRWGDDVPREAALDYLREGLEVLGLYAAQHNVPLVYEPLNRFETNLCTTVAAGVELVESLNTDNVVLLADLFHMNIEESDLPAAILHGGRHIGHVHFVDSNRRPAGCGHIDYRPIIAALKEVNYRGYLSAEALPWPDPTAAAEKTIQWFRRLVNNPSH
jgi:sugar phosphate isomerase/epimerase